MNLPVTLASGYLEFIRKRGDNMPAQQRTITSKEQQEERILRFSFLCSTFFTITEVAMAVVFHSYSILMDGIFDIADLILLGPFLVLVPLLYKPVTEKHPYGYSQLESVFLIVKYGILLFVIISMIGANIGVILEGGHTVDFNGVAVYEMLIGFLCLLVLLALKYLSRKFNSPTIEAEVYLWKQDAVSSMGVALAFFSQLILKNTPAEVIVPYLDSAVAIVMACVLIREPVTSIFHGFRELVLFAPDEASMTTIRNAVDGVMKEYPCSCSFLDVIQTGRKVWIEVYVSPDVVTGMIDVRHWAAIRGKIREELRGEFEQIYVELIPDIPDAFENAEA